MLTEEDIKRYIPHRKPFLFVDKVLEIVPGTKIRAFKKFNSDEEFFKGHFPGNPIVPGVIIVEALAQAGGILFFASFLENDANGNNKMGYLMGLENVKFRRPVNPGDEVNLQVEISRRRSKVVKFNALASVDGNKVAEADIIVSIV